MQCIWFQSKTVLKLSLYTAHLPLSEDKKCLYSQAIEETDGMILCIPSVENEHARFTPEPDWKNTAKILLKS